VICWKERIEKGMGCKAKEGLILERRGKLEERIFLFGIKKGIIRRLHQSWSSIRYLYM
jgi:hypothetical protein